VATLRIIYLQWKKFCFLSDRMNGPYDSLDVVVNLLLTGIEHWFFLPLARLFFYYMGVFFLFF